MLGSGLADGVFASEDGKRVMLLKEAMRWSPPTVAELRLVSRRIWIEAELLNCWLEDVRWRLELRWVQVAIDKVRRD